jgi:hypothetical protein
MMQVVIGMCGAIWIGAGILLWSAARLATQELLACMLVSFGVAFLGIAVVIETINRLAPSAAAQPNPIVDPGNQ